jgi:hypothetical protein
MSQATDYTESAVLTGLVGGTSIALSAGKPFLALFTSAPTDAGGGTECSGGSYVRVQAGDVGQGDFGTPSGGSVTNASEFRWADATADWGTITHIALMSTITGGSMLIHGTLQASVVISNGDIFKIPASGFTITMD